VCLFGGMTKDESGSHSVPSLLARMIHGSPVLIIFFWLGLAVLVNTVVPQLEKVGRTHMVSMVPAAAPSIQAMSRIGQVFGEFDTDTAVMIVIEGDHPLGDDAHRYYAELVRRLSQDKHVEHVQDLWGDPLTAAGSQSLDGKAAYVQAQLVGNQGENLANQSVAAVRRIVATTAPPSGVRAYVAGGAAVTADGVDVGDRGIAKITAITGAVILVMLLFIYRSVATMILIVGQRSCTACASPTPSTGPGIWISVHISATSDRDSRMATASAASSASSGVYPASSTMSTARMRSIISSSTMRTTAGMHEGSSIAIRELAGIGDRLG